MQLVGDLVLGVILLFLTRMIYVIREDARIRHDETRNEGDTQKQRRKSQATIVARFIEQGEDLRKRCLLTEPVPTADVKVWLKAVRTYLYNTYGYAMIVQWESENDFHPRALQSAVPGMNQRMHDLLSHRLYQLRHCLRHLLTY